jgi:predicted Fe-S protein YdhL (DUF1289 family)
MLPPSPCIGVCRIDPGSGLCLGCARTGAEIAIWRDAPADHVDRIWAALPARRAALGITLHRLRWTAERIARFVADSVAPGAGTWVVGQNGALAEYSADPSEPLEIAVEAMRITAATARGAIRFDITERVRVLALGEPDAELYVLALPRPPAIATAEPGLRRIGADADALRPADAADILYDLGLGARFARFCVRTADPALQHDLDAVQGAGWRMSLPALGGLLVAESPARVVTNPLGRIEVFTPMPPPGGPSPAGPHTHLLAGALAAGGESPVAIALPEAYAPCAFFQPAPGSGYTTI